MSTLGAAADDLGTRNSFDALRLLGAVCVVVAHSYALTGESSGLERLGAVGVTIFFAVSGFLITQSWARRPAGIEFAAKRALRLLPALAVVLLLCAYGLGPLVTTRSLGDYLADPQTHLYVFDNLLMNPAYALPGTFEGLENASVNGSLWTLRIEVECYVMVGLVGAAGLLGRAWAMVGLWALAAALTTGLGKAIPGGSVLLGLVSHRPGATLVGVFAGASVLYVWRHRVPLRATWAAVALAVWLVSTRSPHHHLFTIALAPYVFVAAGFLVPHHLTRLSTRWGDLSYGTYLVAFPVQQTLALSIDPSAAVMMLVTIPVSLALAALSWRYVERPSLALKRHLVTQGRAAPNAQPAGA